MCTFTHYYKLHHSAYVALIFQFKRNLEFDIIAALYMHVKKNREFVQSVNKNIIIIDNEEELSELVKSLLMFTSFLSFQLFK